MTQNLGIILLNVSPFEPMCTVILKVNSVIGGEVVQLRFRIDSQLTDLGFGERQQG